MGEKASVLDYESTWSDELESDLFNNAYERKGLFDLVYRNFWIGLASLFFLGWGVIAILANSGILLREDLPIALKLFAAGFATAMIPVVALLVLQERIKGLQAFCSDSPMTVRCDETGCHTELEKSTSFVPWSSVKDVTQTDRGVLLRIPYISVLPIYDARLRRQADREALVYQIERWREAAQ